MRHFDKAIYVSYTSYVGIFPMCDEHFVGDIREQLRDEQLSKAWIEFCRVIEEPVETPIASLTPREAQQWKSLRGFIVSCFRVPQTLTSVPASFIIHNLNDGKYHHFYNIRSFMAIVEGDMEDLRLTIRDKLERK